MIIYSARYYDIELSEAKIIVADMFRVVKENWRELAKKWIESKCNRKDVASI
ncbi:hypothetical protein SAMN02745671_00424 [Anaerovibrio lipolyticus DSM 3074]|uniref:Uncharacterized protein n=1 Tax=Anaerovibrio lipolyticus DSM 3074 TaxID=1120997 RepID=A0A1M6ALT0_9FIRM|nr:hypothetical protein SAMN02745671_00424 [Anaerovibrio lipolyticus DSM 3074]